jgi:hypothetical protein
MISKYDRWFAILMMAGLFACDESAGATSATETATATARSNGSAGQSTTSTTSKPTKAAKATCAAVVDKIVSFAPEGEAAADPSDAASSRKLLGEMCEDFTEDQRNCILSANGNDEVDKCVDTKK